MASLGKMLTTAPGTGVKLWIFTFTACGNFRFASGLELEAQANAGAESKAAIVKAAKGHKTQYNERCGRADKRV